MFDFQETASRGEPREERTVRQEESSVIGLTHQVMNSLAELWRLYHHRRNLNFWLGDCDGDLGVMSRMAHRVRSR